MALLVLLWLGVTAAYWDDLYNQERLAVVTQDKVNYIAEDLFVEGNILFCELSAMLTTDLERTDIIAGKRKKYYFFNPTYVEGVGTDAAFKEITSFAQINSSHVLVTDSRNGCVRMLDRTTNSTSRVAGTCGKLASYRDAGIDSSLLNSTFYYLSGIALIGNTAYVTDIQKQAIRRLDLLNDRVTTVVSPPSLGRSIHQPVHLLPNPDKTLLYVTFRYGIGTLNLKTNVFEFLSSNVTVVSGKVGGDQDGLLIESKWKYVESMDLLDNFTIVLGDVNNVKIRVIDFKTGNVSSWCIHDPLYPNCTITKPTAVRRIGRRLFIGHSKKITSVPLPQWFVSKTDGKEMPASPSAFLFYTEVTVTIVLVSIGVLVILVVSAVLYWRRSRRSSLNIRMPVPTYTNETFRLSGDGDVSPRTERKLQ